MTTSSPTHDRGHAQCGDLSPLTQSSYVQQVSMFARHFDRSQAVLGPERHRDYQLYLTRSEEAFGCQLGQGRCLGDSISVPVTLAAVGFRRGRAEPQEASHLADHSQC